MFFQSLLTVCIEHQVDRGVRVPVVTYDGYRQYMTGAFGEMMYSCKQAIQLNLVKHFAGKHLHAKVLISPQLVIVLLIRLNLNLVLVMD